MTESLQAVHTFTGLPWWALIPLTTVTLRTVWTLPLAVLQRKRIQKQSELRPLVSAMSPVLKLNLAKKVQAAKRKAQKSLETSSSNGSNSDSTETFAALQSPLASMKYEEVLVLSTKETRKRQKALFKKNNVQLWKNMILPAFQVPLWVSMSLTMRDLSGWTSWDSLANKPLDEALYSEGLFWFTDLTSFDQLHVFPLLVGITALCNVEWTFKTLELSRLTMKKRLRPTLTDAISNLSRMTVVFMMAISLNAPSALTLYWLSSQVYSLVQNVILDLTLPISFTPRKRFNYKESKSANARPVINTHS
ncbi:hypothetical protein G9P44_000160 [Scheffersomyces stipitis]|nr:hypothetical protein G9P44_000160 [Scheffersomyces stipitis]